jgi:hypothetical protein
MTKPALKSNSNLEPYEQHLVDVIKYIGAKNGNKAMAFGRSSTVTASDTIVTGLASLDFVIASMDDDPSDDPAYVSASIGNQAGAPAAGSFLLKSWTFTNVANDATPTAAGTFTKKVNWIAVGTPVAKRDDANSANALV